MGETTGGVLRRGSDRIVAGVCSGLAHYFGVDALLVRIAFVILALIPTGLGIMVIIYFVLWFLMDPPAGAPVPASRSVGNRLSMMGQEIREDFRSGFARSSADAPRGAPAASAGGSQTSGLSPGPRLARGPRGLWFGIILIALGAYLLISNLGLLSGFRWDIFIPAVFIVIGVLFLVRRR